MKKLIFIAFLLGSLWARGQEYVPLINENAIWSVSHEKYIILGDTIINEVSLKKLYFHDSIVEFNPEKLEYIAALRESKDEGKVWIILKNTEKEELLYDFSLSNGSRTTVLSLPLFFNNEEIPSQKHEIEILSIDEIEIGGLTRKRLKLKSEFTTFETEYWIEGIGSTSGLVYPGNSFSNLGIADLGYPNLLCYSKNDEIIYQNEIFNTCFLYPLNVGIKDLISPLQNFKVVFHTENTLMVTGNRKINFIELIDISGRKIFSERVYDPNTYYQVDISGVNKGIYLIRIYSEKSITSIKFLKSH